MVKRLNLIRSSDRKFEGKNNMFRSKRLNVEISKNLFDDLDSMAIDENSTITSIIRQGIALLKIARDAKKQNKHIGFVSDPDQLDVLIVGLFC